MPDLLAFNNPHRLVLTPSMFPLASWLLLAAGAYLAAGACFAVAFVWRGLEVIDAAAKGMPIPARLLILPGAAALWPVLLLKWLRRQQPPVA